jgi:AraC-like DNA-binding protein
MTWSSEKLKSISIFYRYILSNVILFCLPTVLIGFFMLDNTIRKLDDEIRAMYSYKLDRIESDINTQFKKLSSIALSISQNKLFKPSFIKENPYNEIQMLSVFRSYADQSQIADDILFIFKGGNELYATDGKYYSGVYFGSVLLLDDWDGINERLSGITSQELHTYPDSQGNTILLFMYPISTINVAMSSKDAVVVFVVPEENIRERIFSISGYIDGDFSLFKGNQAVINGNNGKYNDFLVHYNNADGKGRSGNYAQNSLLGPQAFTNTFWGVLSFNSEGYTETVNKLKRNYELVLLLLFLFCLGLGIFFAYRNYRPLKSLEESVKDDKGNSRMISGGNEIDNINYFMNKIITDNRHLEDHVEKQNVLLRLNALNLLLSGRDVPGEYLRNSGVVMDLPYFCIIALREQESENSGLIDNIASRHAEEDVFPGVKAYFVKPVEDNIVVFICNLDENWRILRMKFTEHIKDYFIAEKRNICIGAGAVYQSTVKLEISYIEAMTALQYTRKSAKGICCFDELKNPPSVSMDYPMSGIMYLAQSVKMGNLFASINSLKGIIDTIKSDSGTYMMKRCIIFDVINSIFKISTDHKIFFPYTQLSNIISFKDLDDLFANLSPLVTTICNSIKEKHERRNSGRASEIIQYINSNFCDYNIGLKSLCDKFDLSLNYLSKIVKEETGETFHEYLSALRIEEAKKYLIEGNINVQDICKKVGYTNVPHFIKIFKNNTGLTPAKYRGTYK